MVRKIVGKKLLIVTPGIRPEDYIKKNDEILPWKDFNKNMAVAIEYNLEY